MHKVEQEAPARYLITSHNMKICQYPELHESDYAELLKELLTAVNTNRGNGKFPADQQRDFKLEGKFYLTVFVFQILNSDKTINCVQVMQQHWTALFLQMTEYIGNCQHVQQSLY